MRGPLLLVLLLAGVAGCADDEERATPPATTTAPPTTTAAATTTTEPEAGPVALVPTPTHALRRCRRFPAVARACPHEVPGAPFDPASPIYAAESHPGARRGTWVFSLQWGGEHPGEPELDRPPATVHVVVLAGEPLRGAPPRRVVALRDGLLEEPRRAYLSLGRAGWGGRRGELLLAPPFPRGGIESNHLVFRWREMDAPVQVSLHGWEPFTEVKPVLRAVVESIGGAR